MVRLQSKNKYNRGVFYFHTMDECNDFLYVFSDHFCNVDWEKPVEISDNTMLSYEHRRAMDIPPKERAERYLSWGFDVAGKNLTREQMEYVEKIAKGLN